MATFVTRHTAQGYHTKRHTITHLIEPSLLRRAEHEHLRLGVGFARREHRVERDVVRSQPPPRGDVLQPKPRVLGDVLARGERRVTRNAPLHTRVIAIGYQRRLVPTIVCVWKTQR